MLNFILWWSGISIIIGLALISPSLSFGTLLTVSQIIDYYKQDITIKHVLLAISFLPFIIVGIIIFLLYRLFAEIGIIIAKILDFKIIKRVD